MQTKNKLKTFLVKHLNISNKKVLELILHKKVLLNGKPATTSSFTTNKDEIRVDGKLIQKGTALVYIKFNKPRGIESTMNKKIPHNLTTVFKSGQKLFPVGRLDKESEGLMIFTNDGEYYKRITDKEKNIEKEYMVEVNKPVTEEFLIQMRSGVKIMGKLTKNCKAKREAGAENIFNIILTEGMNRQIRRMCYKLGYKVLSLKRVRIDNIELGHLQRGASLEFDL